MSEPIHIITQTKREWQDEQGRDALIGLSLPFVGIFVVFMALISIGLSLKLSLIISVVAVIILYFLRYRSRRKNERRGWKERGRHRIDYR